MLSRQCDRMSAQLFAAEQFGAQRLAGGDGNATLRHPARRMDTVGILFLKSERCCDSLVQETNARKQSCEFRKLLSQCGASFTLRRIYKV
jgi:hypothetical protein